MKRGVLVCQCHTYSCKCPPTSSQSASCLPLCLTYTSSSYLTPLFYSIMSDEIKSTLFAPKRKKGKKKKKRAGGWWWLGWWYDSCTKLDSRLLKPPDKLLTTACAADGKAGSRLTGIYFSLNSPLLA